MGVVHGESSRFHFNRVTRPGTMTGSGLINGKCRLEELEGNLMRLDTGQLAEHPMVRELVRATQER
jgi:hypothetical protein